MKRHQRYQKVISYVFCPWPDALNIITEITGLDGDWFVDCHISLSKLLWLHILLPTSGAFWYEIKRVYVCKKLLYIITTNTPCQRVNFDLL